MPLNAQTRMPATAPTSRRRAIYALSVLSAISFFNYMDRMAIAVLVEPIKRDLGLSDTQMGIVAGFAFAALYAVLGLPLARIADRRSRVTLLSICVAAWSIMTMVTGLARSFIELFAARMGVGVGEAGCVPASHSLIGDLFPGPRRAFAISVFQAGGALGMSVGLAATGIIADTWGWRTALIAIGLAGIPLALVTFLTMKEPARLGMATTPVASESMLATVKALAARPALLHLVMGISVGAFAIYGMAQWIPAFFVRIHGLSLTEIGLYQGLASAVSSVCGVLAGGAAMIRLGKKDDRWEFWWPMLSYGLSGPIWLLAILTDNIALAFGLVFVAGFIASSGVGIALSAIQSYAEPHRRATAIALVLLMSSMVGLGVGPVAVGLMSDLLAPQFGVESLRYALMISTSLLIWSGFHFWLASRRTQSSSRQREDVAIEAT